MNHDELVKQQFNIQAKQFSTWSTTVNETYNRRFFQFCGIRPEDHVLDVACGSGAFSIFCAKQAARVTGVDISDNMLSYAQQQAQLEGLKNAEFKCHSVEHLPEPDSSFSIVLSKAAFHHFPSPNAVFLEMQRCCRPGGRLCIQDILAYADPEVDAYFEQLEKAIDRCHYRTWPKRLFLDMFEGAGITSPRAVEVQVPMAFDDYISHAAQDETARAEIEKLIQQGQENPAINAFLSRPNGRLSFTRNVLLIRGQKSD